MNNIDNGSFEANPSSGNESLSAWDAVANYSENEINDDRLGELSIKHFGASIDAEESDLTPPMILGPDGNKIPFRGRKFSGEQVPLVPVQRTNGDVEQWMALGMTEKTFVDPQTDRAEVVQLLIAGSIDSDGRRVVKKIPLNKHLETAERARQARYQQKKTPDVVVGEQLAATADAVDENAPEAIIGALSMADQDALKSFAYHAANKRDAQRGGNGEESSMRSRWMGEELKKMSPAARDVARRYTTRKWGDDNVAF